MHVCRFVDVMHMITKHYFNVYMQNSPKTIKQLTSKNIRYSELIALLSMQCRKSKLETFHGCTLHNYKDSRIYIDVHDLNIFPGYLLPRS